MIASANHLLNVPSKKSFMRSLKVREHEVKTSIYKILSEAPSVSLTCDLWSKFGRSFLGLTAHYIKSGESGDFKLCTFFLALVPVHVKATSENIAKADDKVLIKQYRLNLHKFFSMTTDNGKNLKNFAMNSQYLTWIACFAHCLQLVIKCGIDRIKKSRAISKAASLADNFRNNSEYRRRLRDQFLSNGSYATRCVVPNATRWSSFATHLESLLRAEDSIRHVLLTWKAHEDLTFEEWRQVEALHKFLDVFVTMTETVQHQTEPTISLCRHYVELLQKACEANADDCPILASCKKAMLENASKYFAPYLEGG
jgi:hypothetical protein